MKPDVSVVIVNWNTRDLLLECLASVSEAAKALKAEVFVVDNGSTDGSADAAASRHPEAVIIRNTRNMGFGAANNLAMARSSGRIILFLNSDAVLNRQALEGLIAFLDGNPAAGCATPQLVDPDGSLQNSFDNVPSLASELLNKWMLRMALPRRYPSKRSSFTGPVEVEAPIGACLAVKAEAVAKTGGFDERFFFFLEETDLCLRIRQAGWSCWLLPNLEVVHGKGKSKAARPCRAWIEYYRSNYAFFRKHRGTAASAFLKAGKVFKLSADAALTLAALLLTAGLAGRPRRKLPVYAALLWWHARLCPPDAGLEGLNRPRGSPGL